jgi:hypothetical protein
MYDLVHVELPGCPKPLVERTIVQVIREFCQESLAFQCELDPINVVADKDQYDLDGHPLWTEILMPVMVLLDDSVQEPGVDYEMITRSILGFVSAPSVSSTGGLVVTVALRPRRDSRVIFSSLFEDWHWCWENGVKARLKIQKKKDWSDPQGASIANALYWDGIAKAKMDVVRGGTTKEITVSPSENHAWA